MKKLIMLILLAPALFHVTAQAPEGISITKAMVFDATFWTDDPNVEGAEIYVAGVYKTKIYSSLRSQTIKIREPLSSRLVIRVRYPNGTDREINFNHGKIDRENATISLYAGKQKPLSKKDSGTVSGSGSSSSSGSHSSGSSSASAGSSRSVSSSATSLASGMSSELAGVVGVVGGLVIVGALLSNSESEPTDEAIYNEWEKEYNKEQAENAAANARNIKSILNKRASTNLSVNDSIFVPHTSTDTIP